MQKVPEGQKSSFTIKVLKSTRPWNAMGVTKHVGHLNGRLGYFQEDWTLMANGTKYTFNSPRDYSGHEWKENDVITMIID